MDTILTRDEFEGALDARSENLTDLWAQQQPDFEDFVHFSKYLPNKKDENYDEVIIMHHCYLDTTRLVIFKRLVKEVFQLTHDIRWIGTLITNKTRGVDGTGGRWDVAFMVHKDDLPKLFTHRRLQLGFRWWFDVVGNGDLSLYPLHFRRMYSA